MDSPAGQGTLLAARPAAGHASRRHCPSQARACELVKSLKSGVHPWANQHRDQARRATHRGSMRFTPVQLIDGCRVTPAGPAIRCILRAQDRRVSREWGGMRLNSMEEHHGRFREDVHTCNCGHCCRVYPSYLQCNLLDAHGHIENFDRCRAHRPHSHYIRHRNPGRANEASQETSHISASSVQRHSITRRNSSANLRSIHFSWRVGLHAVDDMFNVDTRTLEPVPTGEGIVEKSKQHLVIVSIILLRQWSV